MPLFFDTNIREPACDSSCFLFVTEMVTKGRSADIKATQRTELIQGGELPWRVFGIHIYLRINYIFIMVCQ